MAIIPVRSLWCENHGSLPSDQVPQPPSFIKTALVASTRASIVESSLMTVTLGLAGSALFASTSVPALALGAIFFQKGISSLLHYEEVSQEGEANTQEVVQAFKDLGCEIGFALAGLGLGRALASGIVPFARIIGGELGGSLAQMGAIGTGFHITQSAQRALYDKITPEQTSHGFWKRFAFHAADTDAWARGILFSAISRKIMARTRSQKIVRSWVTGNAAGSLGTYGIEFGLHTVGLWKSERFDQMLSQTKTRGFLQQAKTLGWGLIEDAAYNFRTSAILDTVEVGVRQGYQTTLYQNSIDWPMNGVRVLAMGLASIMGMPIGMATTFSLRRSAGKTLRDPSDRFQRRLESAGLYSGRETFDRPSVLDALGRSDFVELFQGIRGRVALRFRSLDINRITRPSFYLLNLEEPTLTNSQGTAITFEVTDAVVLKNVEGANFSLFLKAFKNNRSVNLSPPLLQELGRALIAESIFGSWGSKPTSGTPRKGGGRRGWKPIQVDGWLEALASGEWVRKVRSVLANLAAVRGDLGKLEWVVEMERMYGAFGNRIGGLEVKPGNQIEEDSIKMQMVMVAEEGDLFVRRIIPPHKRPQFPFSGRRPSLAVARNNVLDAGAFFKERPGDWLKIAGDVMTSTISSLVGLEVSKSGTGWNPIETERLMALDPNSLADRLEEFHHFKAGLPVGVPVFFGLSGEIGPKTKGVHIKVWKPGWLKMNRACGGVVIRVVKKFNDSLAVDFPLFHGRGASLFAQKSGASADSISPSTRVKKAGVPPTTSEKAAFATDLHHALGCLTAGLSLEENFFIPQIPPLNQITYGRRLREALEDPLTHAFFLRALEPMGNNAAIVAQMILVESRRDGYEKGGTSLPAERITTRFIPKDKKDFLLPRGLHVISINQTIAGTNGGSNSTPTAILLVEKVGGRWQAAIRQLNGPRFLKDQLATILKEAGWLDQ